MTCKLANYSWDYYVKVEFLQADATTRTHEYHLTIHYDCTSTQAMIMAIEKASKDLRYGEMICGVTVI